jgi:pimeloyl-ACP methyl ester carboxylesterase
VSSVTSADGTVVDYDRYGDGPTVILVGGAIQYRGIDERTTRMANLLAEQGYTAVDYDRRGRGRSGDTAPWALEREVEDVAALIAAVGGPAVLYSSSSGATVTLAAATSGGGRGGAGAVRAAVLRGRRQQGAAGPAARVAGGR